MAGLKIFVSYTSADKDWAHWIAWTLKEAGHTPFVHEWEVPAGGNIPDWMERRVKEADHLIGVFSDRYIDPVYSKSERTAAFWSDPIGNEGLLIPIEVSRVSEWPRFVAPLNRLSLLDRDPNAAREALIAFLEPRGPPKEAPKFPGAKPKARVDEAAAFAEGGEALAPRAPLFPPQERQLIGDVAQEKGVDPERLRPILENLGLADVPVDEIADKLREAVDALRAKADAPAPPSNAGPDLDAARTKAGKKLRALDTDGALAVWDAFMAADAFEAALRRRAAALRERADILRLRYDHGEAAARWCGSTPTIPGRTSRWAKSPRSSMTRRRRSRPSGRPKRRRGAWETTATCSSPSPGRVTFLLRRAISPARWRATRKGWRSPAGWRAPIRVMPITTARCRSASTGPVTSL